ncbi:copper transporter [Saccharopolyspora sp. 7B]|uniref:copper transporter n=1 Tax=Saccharopolyspora sp. 7B TaxID=2877240 RepID=UPI001CD60EE0|nr:copper transporter [Saccharopolyspora sp. 7B]MCA1279946.1 copper transporter [Saccharopolyspora sp. 7B]
MPRPRPAPAAPGGPGRARRRWGPPAGAPGPPPPRGGPPGGPPAHTADSPQGRVAAVLALREQLDHRAGHYGTASSAQGAVPGVRD